MMIVLFPCSEHGTVQVGSHIGGVKRNDLIEQLFGPVYLTYRHTGRSQVVQKGGIVWPQLHRALVTTPGLNVAGAMQIHLRHILQAWRIVCHVTLKYAQLCKRRPDLTTVNLAFDDTQSCSDMAGL